MADEEKELEDLRKGISKQRDQIAGFRKNWQNLLDDKTGEPLDPMDNGIAKSFTLVFDIFDQVFVNIEMLFMLTSSLARRNQILMDIITLLTEHQRDPLIKQQLADLLKAYDQAY
jgi:hypothetical protein